MIFYSEKYFLVVAAIQKRVSKQLKLISSSRESREKGQSVGKRGDVASIHLISYRTQIFADKILRCLVDKYQMTY